MTAMTKSRPAGCGCGNAGCGGGCGCASATGGLCADGALAQPRFFAGQLLTQEDLQLIVDYVVGKNRLHNRFLFGEGVVCGLDVTCPPCGGGSVVVAPGYALDCCGNDIYLPCPAEVDVNTLVRDLRQRQLDGWDCGDPCVAKTCDDAKGTAGTPRDNPPPLTYRYCLYIRYRERQVAPIAPYLSDAACGAIACETSRVCEGYSFELRCEDGHATPADILSRLKTCIGDLRDAVAQVQRAQVHSARSAELQRASAMLVAAAPVQLDTEDLAAMSAAAERLGAANLGAASPGAAGIAGADTRPDEAALRRHLADFELLAVGLARAAALDQAARPAGLDQIEKAAREALGATSEPLARLAPDLLGEPVARAAAADLIGVVRRTVLAGRASAANAAEFRLLRAGTAVSASQLGRMQADLGWLKAFLQDRLLRAGTTTRCDLLDRLRRVVVGEEAALDPAALRATASAAEALAVILLEMFRDCLCLALNPPCAPCDDPALLLACLTVRDCEVVDICNMGRRFVLSPAALRYWLPPVSILGRLFEQFCCELEFRRAARPVPPNGARTPLDAGLSFYRTSATPTFSTSGLDTAARTAIERFGLSLDEVEQLGRLGGQLGTLGLAHAPALATLAAAGRFDLAGPARRPEAVPVEALREQWQQQIDDRAKASQAEVLAATREAMATAIDESPAMRELTAESGRLKAELKRLSDAVRKLQH